MNMRICLFKHALGLIGVLALAVTPVRAGEPVYVARLAESVWQMQNSPNQCVLQHDIPDYGVARFTQPAGRALTFSLDLTAESTLASKVVLRAVPSPWNHTLSAYDLDEASMPLDGSRMDFAERLSQSLFTALEKGMFIEIDYPGVAIVNVSSVRFYGAAIDFHTCVAKLSKRTAQAQLTKSETESASRTQSSAKLKAQPEPLRGVEETRSEDMVIADASITFKAGADEFTEDVLITLTGVAREYVLQKKSPGLKLKIGGSADTDADYKKRVDSIKTYLIGQGLPAGRIFTLGRGQALLGKNAPTEQIAANELKVYLLH
jgi:outer membrane protein OmpA-like peptidoglycan-associated protein